MTWPWKEDRILIDTLRALAPGGPLPPLYPEDHPEDFDQLDGVTEDDDADPDADPDEGQGGLNGSDEDPRSSGRAAPRAQTVDSEGTAPKRGPETGSDASDGAPKCPGCGGPVDQSGHGRRRIYCSSACKSRVRTRLRNEANTDRLVEQYPALAERFGDSARRGDDGR